MVSNKDNIFQKFLHNTTFALHLANKLSTKAKQQALLASPIVVKMSPELVLTILSQPIPLIHTTTTTVGNDLLVDYSDHTLMGGLHGGFVDEEQMGGKQQQTPLKKKKKKKITTTTTTTITATATNSFTPNSPTTYINLNEVNFHDDDTLSSS